MTENVNVGSKVSSAWANRVERVLTKKQVADIKKGKTITLLVKNQWIRLRQNSKEDLRLAEIKKQIARLKAEVRRLV